MIVDIIRGAFDISWGGEAGGGVWLVWDRERSFEMQLPNCREGLTTFRSDCVFCALEL